MHSLHPSHGPRRSGSKPATSPRCQRQVYLLQPFVLRPPHCPVSILFWSPKSTRLLSAPFFPVSFFPVPVLSGCRKTPPSAGLAKQSHCTPALPFPCPTLW